MIQELSSRPQCLVEPDSVFLESGLHIQSDRSTFQEDRHRIVKRNSPVLRLLHRDEAAGRFVRDSEGVSISGRQVSGFLPQRERQGWRILTRSDVNNTGGGDRPWIKDR
jgi:hypothetical protein